MSIERLRALEKKWRDEFTGGDDRELKEIGYEACLLDCADDLRDLIAELGQEVGAVAEMPSLRCRSDACANKGQVHNHCTPRAEATPVGCIHPDTLAMFATDHKAKRVSIERWGQLRELEGYLPLYTSPAHTSEARDALRNLVNTVHTVAFSGDYGIHDDAIATLSDALDDANAAMRQEGGTP